MIQSSIPLIESKSRGTPFARVLLIGGAGAVPAGGATHAAPGRFWASSRPALGPVCEVLAALAPGRVLPFAPGNSRKRGPELSGATASCKCRGGAPEGERARRGQVRGPRAHVCDARGRVPHSTRHRLDAPFGASPPSFVAGGGFWKSFSCFVIAKLGRERRRENDDARPPPRFAGGRKDHAGLSSQARHARENRDRAETKP
jgi:hypothetical protein